MLDASLNISLAFRPKSIHTQFRSIAPKGLADQCNPITIYSGFGTEDVRSVMGGI
jgi:hypothetical protein